jgi:hypothetical protein
MLMESTMNIRRLVARLLLAFVLVSIGVAIGKEMSAGRGSADSVGPGLADDRVVVYYMHAAARCAACNAVEAMARELIASRFSDAVRAGRLEWRSVNYEQNEPLARRYDVAGSEIVIVCLVGNKEVSHVRLNRVLEFAGKPDEFRQYVQPAIRKCLQGRT